MGVRSPARPLQGPHILPTRRRGDVLEMPPKPCDRSVCYGRSHLLGLIRGETDHSDMGWPMQSLHSENGPYLTSLGRPGQKVGF